MSSEQRHQLVINATQEDVAWLASVLATYFRYRTDDSFRTLIDGSYVLPLDYLERIDLDSLVTSVGGITDPIGQLKDWLYEQLKGFVDWVLSGVSALWESFKSNVLEPALDAVRSAFDWIKDRIDSIWDTLQSLANAIRSVVVDPLINALKWLANNFSRFTNLVEKAFNTVYDFISKLPNKVWNAVHDIVGRISEAMSNLGNLLSKAIDTVKGIFDAIKDVIDRIASSIRDAFGNLANMIGDLMSSVRNFLENLPSMVKDAISRVSSVVGEVVEAIRSGLESLGGLVSSISDRVRGFFETVLSKLGELGKAISNAFKVVGEWFSKIPEMARSAIDALLSKLGELGQAITNAFNTVGEWLSRIPKLVDDAIKGILSTIGKIGEAISKALEPVARALSSIPQLVGRIVEKITDSLTRIGDAISKALGKVVETLRNLPNAIVKIIDDARKAVEGFVKKVTDLFKPVTDAITKVDEVLRGVWDKITRLPQYIDAAWRAVLNFFKSIAADLGILEKLKDIAPELFEEWHELLSKIRSPIDWLAHYPEVLWLTIRTIAVVVWNLMPDNVKKFFEGVKNAVTNVGNALTGFVNAILKFPEWFPKWFEEHIAKPIASAMERLGEWIWNALPEWLRNAISNIPEVLGKIASVFTNFGEWLWNSLKWLGNRLGEMVTVVGKSLQDALGKAFEWICNAFSTLGSWIMNMVRSFAEWLKGVAKDIYESIATLSRGIAEALSNVFGSLVSMVTSRHSPAFYEVLAGPWIAMVTTATNIYIDTIRKHGKVVETNPAEMLIKLVSATISVSALVYALRLLIRPLLELIPNIKYELRLAPLDVGATIAARVRLRSVIRRFVDEMSKIMPDMARYILIGHMIWWAEPTRAVTREMLTEWLTIELPPMNDTLRAVRRRIPTPELESYYAMFHKQLRMGGIYKGFIEKLYGLPDKLVERIYKALGDISKIYDAEAMSIVIKDRFDQPRYFPTTLVAEIPTPSELARMMIRDIIQDPKYFAAVMAMHGFTPDIAYMFYLLHFRYPPPEKLWEFTCRGIAGELWFDASKVTDPETGKKLIEVAASEAESIGAFAPISPIDLNFKPSALFAALSRYMKWHDYARFSWIKGFTSDNFIVIDLLADIPTKIDLRWMTRWGMFDYWSAHGVGLKTAIHEITRGLIPDGATLQAKPLIDRYLKYLQSGEIVFDLKQFCRVLQATGIHPYWIPWIAIAESINALTEERTLLRTGFINLFKEGIWDLNRLNELLSGFFTVKFEVGYFDMEKNDWAKATVEYPVAFLPAESKLLELRAVMDRALDIYREAYRAVIGAVRTYVLTPDEAKQKLGGIIEAINKNFFSKAIEAISGKQLALVLDEGYFNAWTEYAKLLADVEARERTRFYARYLLWSVIWGLRFGYVTEEEAKQWVDNLIQTMHEHEYVKQAIWLSVEFMIKRFFKEIRVRAIINLLRSRRISIDEAISELKKLGFSEDVAKNYIDANVIWYTPGLTTYATLLEIVPEAINMSLRAIAHFNLPSDELPYWLLYIARKPIQDELTLLRTRIYNALANGMSIEEVVAILSKYAMVFRFEKGELRIEGAEEARKLLEFYERNRAVFQAFGIAPHEWVMYNVIAVFERRIDELRQAVRERIPSPSTLAVLAEYLVLPRDLVIEALKRYGVPPEWMEIWLKYIEVKPIKSDAKALLSVYIRALRYGAVSEDEVKKFIKELANYGFTPIEIELIEKRVALEEAIIEARELRRAYLPTPTMLATLAEYVHVPKELVLKALEARRVPKEWIELWIRYIEVRPLADEARLLATAYFRAKRYGVPLGDLEKTVLEILKKLGFTEEELRIRELRATIEAMIDQWREAQREYIPTPSMLATIAEIVPEARKLMSKVFERRHVPPEWRAIWAKYIQIRPIFDEVRRYVSIVTRMFEYFAIKEDDLRKALEKLKPFGYEDREIELIISNAKMEASLRAYRELVYDPDRMIRLAEYSPRARRIALAQVYKMIDALPTDPATKEFLKKMWEEFIRVRPVYDEVRRYVTELIQDYAEGVIDRGTLENELNQLKDWGLDDYEVQFYLWLAERRRQRYVYREMRRAARF